MAGSIIAVLLNQFTEKDEAIFHAYVKNISSGIDENNFQVFDKTRKQKIPFAYEIKKIANDEDYFKPPSQLQLENTFGIKPVFAIIFSAMLNSNKDELMLGEIALAFAKKVNGIICYLGLLNEENIINVKGEIQKIPFGIADYREIFVHVSDTIFLQHWINNKYFNLIK